jgi:hypothetical protein
MGGSRINVSDSVFIVVEGSIDGDGSGFCSIGYVKFETDSKRNENLFYTYHDRKLPCRIDLSVAGIAP